jgi:uncharacterized membrane protein HdeD (DUF308 family)
MAVKKRPSGVRLLAILEIIAALVYFGLAAVIVSTLLSAVLAILGIISLLLAYGLWTGMGWSWILALIFAVIGILAGIVTVTLPLSVISITIDAIVIIIDVVIIYYLMMPHVKAFFGKAPTPPTPTQPA